MLFRVLVLLAAILGVADMATKTKKAKAQEPQKSEPPTFKHGGYVLNERVTVKEWDAQEKKFLKPHDGVWALRKEVKDKGLMMIVYGKTKPDADLTKNPGVFRVHPPKGSIITDTAGAEYEVIDKEGDETCWVKLIKAAPKKGKQY